VRRRAREGLAQRSARKRGPEPSRLARCHAAAGRASHAAPALRSRRHAAITAQMADTPSGSGAEAALPTDITSAVSALVALTNKRYDLDQMGHKARAADYAARELAAAHALGVPDCLIVADLQFTEVGVLLTRMLAMTDVREVRRAHAKAAELFAAAVESLQRRRAAAGSLRPGACHAWEAEWYRRTLEHRALPLGPQLHAAVAHQALLLGRDAFVHSGTTAALLMLGILRWPAQLALAPQQLRYAWRAMAEVADWILLSRPHEALSEPEVLFLYTLRGLVREPHHTLPQDAVETPRLLETWRRLESTGLVAEEQLCGSVFQYNKQRAEAVQRAQTAAAVAPGLRRCGLASCGAREAHPSHFKSCAACRIPVYCCKEHQTEHWPAHKAACKAARKAAEQQNDAS
jgi:hypothetical protein